MIDHKWMFEPGDQPPGDNKMMDWQPGDHPGLSNADQFEDEFELPFEDNCTVLGEHAHCELHGLCIEPGSDCPACLDMEQMGIWDPRDMIEQDPISSHDPDCQCQRCQIGDDAWLCLHNPEEY